MRCSGAVYRSFFSGWDVLHYFRVSGCFNLDRLELYSKHESQNNDGDRYEGAVYSVVTVQGCARDQHALCASGESLTSPISKNIWVLAAGTIEDRGEELRGGVSLTLRSR